MTATQTLAAPPSLPHLLLVEDDPEIGDLMQRFLDQNGYRVSRATGGAEMDRVLQRHPVDLVLLDLMLPDEHGLALCRRLRATTTAAIIMVTALAELTDVVVGLELGADDYVAKPFELRELAARIRAVLRRGDQRGTDARQSGANPLSFAGWRFHPERRLMYSPAHIRVALTGAEADLLLTFCQHPATVLSRARLVELTHGTPDATSERAIDLLVSRLRRKLAGAGRQLELIRTIRNDGYVFQPDLGTRR